MDKITLPPNGLPQEVTNIPFGQVIVLTNPQEGITAKHITMIEAIISLANKCGQGHIINTRSVEFSGLWDCYACKVKADEVLISDKDSLFEMLCEIWGLDYEEACKTIVLDGRAKFIPYGGEEHPVRVHIKPAMSTEAIKEDYSVTLQVLPDHTKPNALSDIRKAFQDNFYHNLGVSIEEIIDLYDEVKKSTKTYHLHIKVERDKESGKISNCRFILEDNFGKTYPLMKPLGKGKDKPLEEWEAQWKALYLTFIWYKYGLPVREIAYNQGFYDTFLKILGQLPKGYNKPDQVTLWENVNSKISKIRSSIFQATNDTYAQEQFAIDGYSEDVYKVSGATDKNRETIKKEFGL